MSTVHHTTWCLVTTKPGTELGVSHLLSNLNIVHHCFKLLRQVLVRGAHVDKFLPAFPRYIFLDLFNGWQTARQIRGVKLVHFIKDEFLIIGGNIVNSLTARSSTHTLSTGRVVQDVLREQKVETPAPFAVNQPVRVVSSDSVFYGKRVFYQRLLDPDNAIVHLEGVGCVIPMCVRLDEIVDDKAKLVKPKGTSTRGGRKRTKRWSASATDAKWNMSVT